MVPAYFLPHLARTMTGLLDNNIQRNVLYLVSFDVDWRLSGPREGDGEHTIIHHVPAGRTSSTRIIMLPSITAQLIQN